MNWKPREVDWETDLDDLSVLFNRTWTGHPITTKPYFDWHLLENYKGRAVGYCAEPTDGGRELAGVYLVIPSTMIYRGRPLDFSTSMYTITHPSYYRQGIFKGLANLTYDVCQSRGIAGTVGVPNKLSVHGLTHSLKFQALGQLDMMARVPSPLRLSRRAIETREIESPEDLAGLDFSFDRRKSGAGVIMGERNAEFIRWRFFNCPNVSYRVFAALDGEGTVKGLLVLRRALIGSRSQFASSKRGAPITIVVDFVVDHTDPKGEDIVRALLDRANREAVRTLTPFIMVLANPLSYEGMVLGKNGYRRLPKTILPHECNFCIKLHGDQPPELAEDFSKFENWFFSFADFDIF